MMLFGSWWNIDKAAGSDRRLSRLLLDEPGGPLGEDQADQRGDDDKNHGRSPNARFRLTSARNAPMTAHALAE
ncbi:hypothetical protein [Bradyrhizobium japonicum]|uniref:hypothetical protein n=1 Tax=Bradyrhizobium japonicum TaxID=375 RepID=UPI0004567EA4|nr:hypothetical protein [Bradyrhizobium japonicum]AHY54048.1 hypothetical protein BJS_09052 [Bradyrhizobium japonicum SEMIA 5079]MCD9106771.1 hypothetical protein [Bradyrhizobium japonicum]MCD9254110.1 hypothetical protein [Bradyrhizobium japonicum SEMIA 5079]MCD9905508.1 hypothetical protein [Bradyrhizobium japonicum]MCS3983975.1 hypothetical protein [Bradyrhizobium japonicum]